jgi:hypothetical protein
MRRRESAGAMTEYLLIVVAILMGLAWLRTSMETRTTAVMNTAIQQVPIIP